MNDFIQRLKAKPVHVRERIAFGVATGATIFIAIIWITTSLTSTGGFFAPMLSPALSFEKSQKVLDAAAVYDTGRPNVNNSDFVAAAGSAVMHKSIKQAPHLQIVEVSHSFTGSASSTDAKTLIPF